jgi:hypothetical protein
VPDSRNIPYAENHGFLKIYKSQLGLFVTGLGVTQLDLQPVDFVQLTFYGTEIQRAVIIELQISTA